MSNGTKALAITTTYSIHTHGGLLIVRDENGATVHSETSTLTINAGTDSHAVFGLIEEHIPGRIVAVEHDKDVILAIVAPLLPKDYEISEVDGKFVVTFEGRFCDRSNSLAAAQRCVENHKAQRDRIAAYRAAEDARDEQRERTNDEIEKRFAAGNKPVKHRHQGVETSADNASGQSNVDWGHAIWADGFQCVYRWYGDARQGNVYSAD